MINPNLNFKILLLSEKDTFNEIHIENVVHKIYDFDLYTTYIDNCFNCIDD